MSELSLAREPVSPSGRPPPATRREARLRPEHAHRYPAVPPGHWEGAAILVDRIVAARLLAGGPVGMQGRVLSDDHFDFRGGTRALCRPRREDR
jgi:hypothetical protein